MMTRPLLFISDLHLSPYEPAKTALFLAFLSQVAPQAQALYILGDLFDFWIGDDDLLASHQTILQAIKKLTQRMVPCYFIHGNRDFLLGQAAAKMSGMTLLPDPSPIQYQGQHYLISHGDYLCTADKPHQRFRQFYMQTSYQRLFLKLPLKLRRKIAQRIRRHSSRRYQNQRGFYGDIDPSLALAETLGHHCQSLIHGHTHRPIIDTIHHNSHSIMRVTLPTWEETGGYLALSADQPPRLHTFKNTPEIRVPTVS